jgi:Fic family protein
VESINELAKMADEDRANIERLGRAAPSVGQVHVALLERPIVTAAWLAEKTGLSAATVNKSLANLEKIGVVRQLNDSKRNRLFAYGQYMDILNDELL